MADDIVSTGKLAEHLQVSVSTIERAVAALGMKPEVRINGVTYYAAGATEAIAAHLHHEPTK